MKTFAASFVFAAALLGTAVQAQSPEPGAPREKEVIVAQEILQTMGLRNFTPMVIACPGCGRTTSTVFQELAQDIQNYVRDRMPEWRLARVGVENLWNSPLQF